MAASPTGTIRCGCGRFTPDSPFDESQCRVCWRDYHRGRAANQQQAAQSLACVHLGPATGELQNCKACKGSVQVKVFGCAVHGKCTPERPVAEMACCRTCPDRQLSTASAPTLRSLIYYIYPRAGNGVWQRCVGQLLRRMRLFNGRRVVAIATGDGLDRPQDVRDLFTGHVHEFIDIPNNPALRETVAFPLLLRRVQTVDPEECFFFGHAKGVTKPVDDGVTVHRWHDLALETCLDYWPLVARQFALGKVFVGSFKNPGKFFTGSPAEWHYSGSFYWARSATVFRRVWHAIDQAWWGVESWPGRIASIEEAGCLFHERSGMQLYTMDYLRNCVEPEFERWQTAHAESRHGA